jgi:uncharacterized membrane protein
MAHTKHDIGLPLRPEITQRQGGHAAVKQTSPSGTAIDGVFRLSVLIKGLDGLLETLGGILLLVIPLQGLSDAAQWAAAWAVVQDPDGMLATSLLGITTNLTAVTAVLAALYLLAHGVVKLFLVWAVLKDKLWAFPLMIVFLLGFVGYQSYEIGRHLSWGLVALTAFDLVVIVLTLVEFRKRLQLRRRASGLAVAEGEAGRSR